MNCQLISGLAIAVARVPPLSVGGIGLALGDSAVSQQAIALSDFHHQGSGSSMAAGAFLLFVTSFLGIVAAAMLVFGLQGYGNWRKPFAVAAAFMLLSIFVVDKLDRRLEIIFVEDAVKRLFVEAIRKQSDIVSEDAFILQVRGERMEALSTSPSSRSVCARTWTGSRPRRAGVAQVGNPTDASRGSRGFADGAR